MSISATFSNNNYGDFKNAVSGMPRKFTIFYVTTSNFTAWAISNEMDALFIVPADTTPSGFSSDFPNAIHLTGESSASFTFNLD